MFDITQSLQRLVWRHIRSPSNLSSCTHSHHSPAPAKCKAIGISDLYHFKHSLLFIQERSRLHCKYYASPRFMNNSSTPTLSWSSSIHFSHTDTRCCTCRTSSTPGSGAQKHKTTMIPRRSIDGDPSSRQESSFICISLTGRLQSIRSALRPLQSDLHSAGDTYRRMRVLILRLTLGVIRVATYAT